MSSGPRPARPSNSVSEPSTPAVLAVVAAGGALGAAARFEVVDLSAVPSGHFPWATLAINATGSFVLGLLAVVVATRLPSDRYLRPFVATGLLGGYTTYSTFAVEADLLLKDGHGALAAAYVAASLSTCVLAAAAGMLAARVVPRGDP